MKTFEEYISEQTVEVPIGRGRATQSVPRYWYHNVRGRGFDKDGSIAPYQYRKETQEFDSYYKVKPEGYVYLSQTQFGSQSVKVDLTKLDRSLMRLTGQSEGYAVYGGRIPKSAYTDK
jgi:hypothetical protein